MVQVTAACAAVINALVLTLVVIAIVAAAGGPSTTVEPKVSHFAPGHGQSWAPRPLVDIRL